MRQHRILFSSSAAFVLLFVSVSSIGHAQVATLPDIDTSDSPNGIVPFPPGTSDVFTDTFTKYTKLVAPNGKPILYLAFHDGAVVTEEGVVFPYPPDQGIRIIR